MERRLIVLRHAKSSWATGLPDHERPLNRRGKRDAPRIGEALAERGWIPERVLSSDSQRTRETWALLSEVWDEPPQVSFHRELYLAGPRAVEALVGQLSAEVTSAMVIGHNHGWEEVVTWLTGVGETLTTCNAALCSVDGADWAAAIGAAPGWTLHKVLRPKELP